jgi:hypothetical protein
MPHRPDAPDVVLPCRAGDNRELRYALRSLERNVDYRHIWIVGSWPGWLRLDHPHLTAVRRPTLTDKYRTTRSHYQWACDNQDVSDPWIMWNDDFYAIRPVRELPAIHRGRCDQVTPMFATWSSKWANGLRETHALLKRTLPSQVLYNYDIHTPLLVHKRQMRRALTLAGTIKRGAPHVRTLYGNLARLGGTALADPKLYAAKILPAGTTWLSSHERTFSHAVEPHLRRAGLTGMSLFEIPGMPDHNRTSDPRATDPRRSARKRRMRYRVLKTPDGNRVVPEQQATPKPIPTPGRNHR